MKSQNKLVIVTVTAIAALFITQAKAQYRAVGDDGIAASPKVRQMLNARARSAATTQAAPAVASVGYRAVGADGIAASPKVRQALNERERSATVVPTSTAVASVGYRAVGDDGIAASPKLRGQLNQRSRQHPHLTAAK